MCVAAAARTGRWYCICMERVEAQHFPRKSYKNKSKKKLKILWSIQYTYSDCVRQAQIHSTHFSSMIGVNRMCRGHSTECVIPRSCHASFPLAPSLILTACGRELSGRVSLNCFISSSLSMLTFSMACWNATFTSERNKESPEHKKQATPSHLDKQCSAAQ